MSASTDNGLPCIDLLEATPDILRGLMCELTEEDARWKPAPDRFSVAEVLAHLSHSEGHCYRARLDRFLSESDPEFERDDAQLPSRPLPRRGPGRRLRPFRGAARDQCRIPARSSAGSGRAYRHASEGGRDHALADAARMGAARPGAHTPDRGTGARAQVPGGRRPAGRILQSEAMTIRHSFWPLALAGPLGAQTFIQMSDPQFGMYRRTRISRRRPPTSNSPSPPPTASSRHSW